MSLTEQTPLPCCTSEQCPRLSRALLPAGLAGLIILIWLLVFQSAFLIDALGMSRKLGTAMVIVIPLIPLFWLASWNNSRLCLVTATLLIIFGDAFSAICAPAIIGATLPNCLNLLIRWRVSKLRYLVATLLILGFLYFFASFFLGFVSHPVQLTNRMQFDPGFPPLMLGWVSSLLGFTIVYPLIYFPFLLLDVSVKHPDFMKRFVWGLSLIFNGILLYGILQYIQAGGMIRVSSIMRLPTRLGPFIVIFMAFLSTSLLESRGRLKTGYWLVTLILSIIVLFMTQTRIAIAALILLAGMLFVSLITSKSWNLVRRFIIGGVLMFGVTSLLIGTGKMDLLDRFDSSQMESGNSSRDKIMSDYEAGTNLQNVTDFQKAGHFLFGYGMFREREFAHFNLHDTIACCLSVFGAVGLVLYYLPYLAIAWIFMLKTFTAKIVMTRPRFAMACSTILTFFMTGAFHNKLYSPIETAYIWLMAGFILHEELPELLEWRSL
jgi:hypothetical protein